MEHGRRMFFGGNTASGFYSLHSNIISDNRTMLYILKGMPGGGKSSMMKKIGKHLSEEGFTVEFHHCPSDPDSLDSILIRELKVAIVDGTAPHIMDPTYPGLKDRIIDLAEFIDTAKLMENKEEIIMAKKANKRAYFNAFSYLKSARHIYDIMIERNKSAVEFEKVNKETVSLIDRIFSKDRIDLSEEDMLFSERHLFSTANTPEGIVDYTDTILEGIESIYYIKGEIGTGKSTLIKKILDECRIRGYNVEIYHNSTFPEKIESLLINNLNTLITSNGNALKIPHVEIDLNKYFDDNVIDRKDYELYELLYEKARLNLIDARNNHQIMEKFYIPTIDYTKIDKVRDDLLEEILSFSK